MIKTCKGCGNEYASKRNAKQYCSRRCANIATGLVRAAAAPTDKLYIVWSCGGGVQSVAIAALISMGVLPKPDYGIMIDCGYERSETLTYMQNVIIPLMRKLDIPFEMVDTLRYTSNELVDSKGHVNIPAYRRRDDGSVSKLHTHCNNKWKVRVSRMWLREHGINNCSNWVGISTDEARRAQPSRLKWITLRYPLIDLQLDREQCKDVIRQAGLPVPPRSSCLFCPQQDRASWSRLYKDNPQDWLRAVEYERQIRAVAPDVYLHHSCIPLDKIF